MRSNRLDRWLAGTALVVVLASAGVAQAAPNTPDAVEAAVPVPEPAQVQPLTPADVADHKAAADAVTGTVSKDATKDSQAAKPADSSAPAPAQAATPPVPAQTGQAAPAPAAAPATQATAPSLPPAAPAAAAAAPAAATPASAVTDLSKSATPATPAANAAGTPAAATPPAAAETPAKDAPKAAEAVAPPPDPVAEKIKDMLAGKSDKYFSSKKERASAEQFYAARNYAPIWYTDGAENLRAKTAIGYLGTVDSEGLDPADYPTPYVKGNADPDAIADAEIRLTASLITFARHAQTGRVHYSRISADIYYNLEYPDPADVLAKLADSKDVWETLASYNPPHAGYKALKAKLADARGQNDTKAVPIPSGPVLKLAKAPVQDPRVPLLRERLKIAGAADDTTYDKTIADAVTKFQQSRGLAANGQLNSATVDAINGRRRDRDVDIIIANMERWRWLPRDLGKNHVILNIPDYTLRVYHDDKVLWQTRVVVGKPSTATPLLSETMKYITVNPTWNVPPSIVYNEYLPALQQDPTVLQRMGLRLEQNRDGSVHISQPPGEKNALGRIRFNFPNRFLVYQHDTPDKYMFAYDKRAFSHGCMRVQDPAKYAEVLLGLALPNDHYTQDRIKSMFGSSEIDIKFPTPIPVHITYQTAFVDDAGKLEFREDIYGRDARVIAALKGDERRLADVPMERSQQQSYARPPVNLPAGTPIRGASYASGPSFFEMLFGTRQPAPPAPVRPQRRTVLR